MSVPSNWFSLCFDLFTGTVDTAAKAAGLSHVTCVKLVISKLLGYLIIAGSCIVKVPQILKFYRAGEAKGVNVNMYILETIGYTITVAYNIRNGYAFSTYGENAFIWVQNAILIVMMFNYAKALNAKFAIAVCVYSAGAYALFSGLLTAQQMEYAQFATVPVFASSKVPQIITSYKNQNTGQLAFITCFMNFAGVLARIFTTFAEVPSFVLRVSVVSALIFNGIVVLQFFLYADANKKITAAAKKTDEPKSN